MPSSRPGYWPARRGPAGARGGIALWQALSASALLAAAGAGLALALPALRLSGDLSAVLRECVMAVRAQYASPGGALTAAVGAAFAATMLASAGWCVSRELMAAAAARRTHRDLLRLTSRPCDPDRAGAADPVVVQHATLAAYCLPGRGGRIVLTSAALAALSPDELAAVLAHERAHLSGRHHLALAAAAGYSGPSASCRCSGPLGSRQPCCWRCSRTTAPPARRSRSPSPWFARLLRMCANARRR